MTSARDDSSLLSNRDINHFFFFFCKWELNPKFLIQLSETLSVFFLVENETLSVKLTKTHSI